MNNEQKFTPIAWGIFGFFPDSGGWCLQAGKVYTSQAAANDAYLGEYENSSRFMVMPLFAHPSPQPETATIDAEGSDWDAAKAITESFIYRIPGATDATRIQYRKEICALIRKHTSAHAGKQGWVKCSERLPEVGDEVIVFINKSIYKGPHVTCLARLLHHEDGDAYYWNTMSGGSHTLSSVVTHWMPLPAAPASPPLAQEGDK